MNHADVGSVSRLSNAAASYVQEVRAELADLPTEDLDDLTGGMEADLSELATESGGDLVGRLGSPKQYAAELRAAAGLPERVPGSASSRRPLSEAMNHARTSFTLLTEQHAWLPPVVEFLVSIRPAWWVLRGYLAAWALWSLLFRMIGLLPHDVLHLAMALAGVVVSVKLGQGWMAHRAMTRPLLMLGNATAVIVALVASSAGVVSGEVSGASYDIPAGVSWGGAEVGNIYPYDSDGRRLTGVRLFAPDGRPLDADQSTPDANGSPLRPGLDSSGAPLLNVYPRALAGPDPWQVTDPANPQGEPPAWTPPVAIVPLAPSALPTSAPTATAPAPPTGTETGTPPTGTPTAQATPSAKAAPPTPERTPRGVSPTSTPPAPSGQPTRG